MNIDASTLIRAAHTAAGMQQYPSGALYVVATPIGNLADLTLRAIHVLGLVDAIACEDTRTSGTLLRHLGVSKPLLALHEHNEAEGTQNVLRLLAQGQRVAYISDAGTPAVSDPGARLVAGVAAAGHRVVPIPGVSSATAALSVAGDTVAQGFLFVGFLPSKGQERAQALRHALQSTAAAPASLVLFEAPHRCDNLASLLAQEIPDRPVTVCRELTKQFEALVTLPARDLPPHIAQATADGRLRGEFVWVIHACAPKASSDVEGLAQATQHVLELLVKELPLKQAVALATQITGAPRNALYQAALALKTP